MRASSWRTEPAAALRGLAGITMASPSFSPAARRASRASAAFSCAVRKPRKSAFSMKTSPRISMRSGKGGVSLRGRDGMVSKLAVTSSPSAPSPRVAPLMKTPFSYSRLIESPSIFGSPTKASAPSSASPRKRRIRLQKSLNSSGENTLSRLSIGSPWRDLAKPSATAAPTRRDGLSVRIKFGKRASIARLRATSAS